MFETHKMDKPPGLILKYRSNRVVTNQQAWDISILKWKLILHVCSQGRLIHDGGIDTCGFCGLYYYGHSDECEDCPIKIAGYMGCNGTPYRDYLAAVEKGDLALAKQAAASEIKFLRRFKMGKDFSYRLYFKRNQLEDVLQRVAMNAWDHKPPVSIHFPDHVFTVPLNNWGAPEKDLQYDDPEFFFLIVLKVHKDEAIMEYLSHQSMGDETIDRSPPDPDEDQVGIGVICLTVYRDIPDQPDPDLVLFDFGATSTQMSLLFEESTSFRHFFLGLLEEFQGICGVFNREYNGDVFWLNGQEQSECAINDPNLLPGEIEALLGKNG